MQNLKIEVQSVRSVFTLNRPKVCNASSDEMVAKITVACTTRDQYSQVCASLEGKQGVQPSLQKRMPRWL